VSRPRNFRNLVMLCVTATRKKHNSSQARKKTHNVVWHHQLITIKTWQLRMHCNVKPPEPRQPFPALITTPCQVWSRWTYPLPYYSVFCCWYITLYPATLTSDFVTFDLQRLHRIACDVIKLCTKFERNRAIRGGVIAISMFDPI